MKIAFVHPKHAFLPELAANQSFFLSKNIQVSICNYGEEAASGADVYWYIMGIYPRSPGRKKMIIHEYTSASVPPYRKLKDFLKSKLNPRPDFRLFLNEYVRQEIHTRDETPFGYRDMGITDDFFPTSGTEKEFDFIYTGSLSPESEIDKLIRIFRQGAMKNRSILLLGKNEPRLTSACSQFPNIIFKGPVPRKEVPGFLSRARFAINYIPDREPFNAQTSTKFLEYAAMHIPIISTNYYWISQFQERFGGEYFLLKEDLSNLSWRRITSFNYAFPNLDSWHWEQQLRESGVLEYLQAAFPKVSF